MMSRWVFVGGSRSARPPVLVVVGREDSLARKLRFAEDPDPNKDGLEGVIPIHGRELGSVVLRIIRRPGRDEVLQVLD